MCHNHSHLIARFLGEDSSMTAPVLIFQLANKELIIEAPDRGGMKLILNTSGVLYLPSWVADGSYQSLELAMGGARTSLFLLPDAASITTLTAARALLTSSWQSTTTPAIEEDSPTPAIGATAEDDAPF